MTFERDMDQVVDFNPFLESGRGEGGEGVIPYPQHQISLTFKEFVVWNKIFENLGIFPDFACSYWF